MSEDNTHFQQLMEDWTSGSQDAAQEVIKVYTPYIIRAVRRGLPEQLRPKVDSMDFVQSIWLSLVHVEKKNLHFEKPEQLIGFLAVMARNKVIDKFRQFTDTQARDIRVEQGWEASTEVTDVNGYRVSQPASITVSGREPSPSQAAIFSEECKKFELESDERDRTIARLRGEGLSYIAIAEKMKIGEKTVRRRLIHMLEKLT